MAQAPVVPERSAVRRKDIEDRSWEEQQQCVMHELLQIYKRVVVPVEEEFAYEQFRPSYFSDVLISPTPFILFLGPFSAGKTTFLNYLLGGDYLWTGPEPTTNRFTVVFHGDEVTNISGRILASNVNMPFKGLQRFGNDFLEGFSGYQVPSDLLRSVTLVDTPGVLETSDVHTRSYEYIKVMNWFVERSDLIFVMFDPTKLDAGRELRSMFQTALKGHESRVRIVLNKADSVGQHELMKVHGALFWNLSNLISSSEPPRVYVSSFWAKPYQMNTNHQLFESEKQALMYDLLHAVPLEALDRKVTALLKRAQDIVIHACIIGTLRAKLPKYFGKRKGKCETIDNIDQVYAEVQAKFKLTAANFPPMDDYKEFFTRHDLYDFPKLKSFEEKTGLIAAVQQAIEKDIPALLKTISSEAASDPRKSNMLRKMLERQQEEAATNLQQQPTPAMFGAPPTQFGQQPHQLLAGGSIVPAYMQQQQQPATTTTPSAGQPTMSFSQAPMGYMQPSPTGQPQGMVAQPTMVTGQAGMVAANPQQPMIVQQQQAPLQRQYSMPQQQMQMQTAGYVVMQQQQPPPPVMDPNNPAGVTQGYPTTQGYAQPQPAATPQTMDPNNPAGVTQGYPTTQGYAQPQQAATPQTMDPNNPGVAGFPAPGVTQGYQQPAPQTTMDPTNPGGVPQGYAQPAMATQGYAQPVMMVDPNNPGGMTQGYAQPVMMQAPPPQLQPQPQPQPLQPQAGPPPSLQATPAAPTPET